MHNPRLEISRDLEILVQMCLKKEPDRRYGSAAVLADDFGRDRDGVPIRSERIGSTLIEALRSR